MPVDLLRAIQHANKLLDWFENLTEDDTPPEWMWRFDDELVKWFDEVKERRKSGYEPDDRTEVPLMGNELAEGRGRG